MAERTRRSRRKSTMKYESYGNVAYSPEVQGGAVAAPRPEESIPLPRRRVQERTQPRALTRTQVQVREAGVVAPFGVIGFLVAAAFAVMLMINYAEQIQLNTQVAALQSEYSAVQVENASLSAQYERLFDIASIEAAVAGTMVRPSAEQVVYLDLSQPDQVNNYGADQRVSGVAGLVSGIQEIIADMKEYFQ